MPTINHVHTYRRLKKNIYKCDDPYCTHIAEAKLILGKMSKCSKCREQEMILTHELLRLAMPACNDCRDTKEARMMRAGKDIMRNLGVI